MRLLTSTSTTALVMLGLIGATTWAADAPTSKPAMGEKMVTPSGLTIIEKGTPTGDAALAKAGDQVWVEYTGKLENGTKFDASADHPGQPLIFVLGQGQVIRGWDEGIAGMTVGQKRQLIIPPTLGYGAAGAGPIPANSTLIFDVQLLGLKKAS